MSIHFSTPQSGVPGLLYNFPKSTFDSKTLKSIFWNSSDCSLWFKKINCFDLGIQYSSLLGYEDPPSGSGASVIVVIVATRCYVPWGYLRSSLPASSGAPLPVWGHFPVSFTAFYIGNKGRSSNTQEGLTSWLHARTDSLGELDESLGLVVTSYYKGCVQSRHFYATFWYS